MADIEGKVKEIVMNKLGVEATQVTPEASFTNDLGADSLDTVELVDRKSTRLNSSHIQKSRMPSSA